MVVRTKVYVCGRSIAATEGSNTSEGMDVRHLCLLCDVQVATSETNWSLVQRSPTECARLLTCGLETSNEAA